MDGREKEAGHEISFKAIGVIHSPFKEPTGTPIQPRGARDVPGTALVFEPYQEGLKDLDGFSHVILIYYFHLATAGPLIAKPFLDQESHGIFAIRAPSRPNPIGISVVRLCGMDDGRLHLKDVDIVDGTPLLDIKPYVPDFDNISDVRTGWLEQAQKTVSSRRADDRFKKEKK